MICKNLYESLRILNEYLNGLELEGGTAQKLILHFNVAQNEYIKYSK